MELSLAIGAFCGDVDNGDGTATGFCPGAAETSNGLDAPGSFKRVPH
jgi:hypothetical protein